jgi:predicted sulfurtransferase
VLLYYKYVSVEDVAAVTAEQERICAALNLHGRIRVAPEGINGTVGGQAEACDDYIAAMDASGIFAGTDFKVSDCEVEPFPNLVVNSVKEVVSSGRMAATDVHAGGAHLSAAAFHEVVSHMDAEKDTLVDVRNRYENVVGHFEGAVNPDTRNFSQFADWVDTNADSLSSKGGKVIMYCTGGVRCEKASAYVMEKCTGVQGVVQLQGGIHCYLEQYPDGGLFRGANFVFDQRVIVNTTKDDVISHCSECHVPSANLRPNEIVCSVCRDLVVVCEACIASGSSEHYCTEHEAWRGAYSADIGKLSTAALEEQLSKLMVMATELDGQGQKLKNRRRTIRKQIEGVRLRIDTLKSAA